MLAVERGSVDPFLHVILQIGLLHGDRLRRNRDVLDADFIIDSAAPGDRVCGRKLGLADLQLPGRAIGIFLAVGNRGGNIDAGTVVGRVEIGRSGAARLVGQGEERGIFEAVDRSCRSDAINAAYRRKFDFEGDRQHPARRDRIRRIGKAPIERVVRIHRADKTGPLAVKLRPPAIEAIAARGGAALRILDTRVKRDTAGQQGKVIVQLEPLAQRYRHTALIGDGDGVSHGLRAAGQIDRGRTGALGQGQVHAQLAGRQHGRFGVIADRRGHRIVAGGDIGGGNRRAAAVEGAADIAMDRLAHAQRHAHQKGRVRRSPSDRNVIVIAAKNRAHRGGELRRDRISDVDGLLRLAPRIGQRDHVIAGGAGRDRIGRRTDRRVGHGRRIAEARYLAERELRARLRHCHAGQQREQCHRERAPDAARCGRAVNSIGHAVSSPWCSPDLEPQHI